VTKFDRALVSTDDGDVLSADGQTADRSIFKVYLAGSSRAGSSRAGHTRTDCRMPYVRRPFFRNFVACTLGRREDDSRIGGLTVEAEAPAYSIQSLIAKGLSLIPGEH
jgi:hypothetical protein